MAYLSAFERVAMAEAKVLTLTALVKKQAVDIQILQAQMAAIMPRVPSQPVAGPVELAKPLARMADIASRVAAENMVTLTDLRGQSRERRVAWPRQEAMRRMVEEGYSTPQIGRFLGGRDHTTVMHGARAAGDRAEKAKAPE